MRIKNLLQCVALLTLVFSISIIAAEPPDLQSLRRKTPSGQYIDPASFFRFHGYITLTYAMAEDFLDKQILVSGVSPVTGKNESGFRNDSALFVGGEPFEGVGSVIEIHFVGNSLDPVITEAKVIWALFDEESDLPIAIRIVGGRYWWPFGIHNDEWFSAINRFNLLSPTAGMVVPPHYDEVGLMAEGEFLIAGNLGGNFVLSVGNGVPSFSMMEIVGMAITNHFDLESSRTFTGRIGCSYLADLNLEVGFSGAIGGLRDVAMTEEKGDPRHYPADLLAFGPDLVFNWKGVGLRGYYYLSQEKLEGASVDRLDRNGFTVEPSYTLETDLKFAKALTLVGRYSLANVDLLNGKKNKATQYGVGLNIDVTKALTLRAGYLIQSEEEALTAIDNNALIFSMTGEF